jgi:hypothetical protein
MKFKNTRKTKNFTLSPQAGTQDLLKMYKHFPDLIYPPDGTRGCYLTKVLMDSGYIWSKFTKDGVARGKPSKYSSRTWICEGENFQHEEKLRIAWRLEGFILPRNYWCGPKPVLQKEFKVPPQGPHFTPSKDFLKRMTERDQRIQALRANTRVKGLE